MFALVANTGTYASRIAPAVLPMIKQVGPDVIRQIAKGGLYAIALNEVGRLNINRQNRKVEEAAQPEVTVHPSGTVIDVTPERPLWKRALDIRDGETFEQGVQRRGRVFWDIACYGLGNELYGLNFVTVKVIKAATWVVGAALTVVGFPVTHLALGVAVAFGMTSERYAELSKRVGEWLKRIAYAPFRLVRRVDHFIEDVAWKLMANRSSRYMDRKFRVVDGDGNKTKLTTHEVPVEVEEAPLAEVKIDEQPVKPAAKEVEIDAVVPVGEGLAEVHDIQHHFVTVTIDLAEIKKNPVEAGKKLFAEEYEQSNLVAATSYRQTTLPGQLKKAGVTGRVSVLVLRGFDEAAKAAGSGETTATS